MDKREEKVYKVFEKFYMRFKYIDATYIDKSCEIDSRSYEEVTAAADAGYEKQKEMFMKDFIGEIEPALRGK